MDITETLSLVTCVSSILTLVVVTLAFLPQVKQLLVVIRDVVLWVTLVAVMAATGWLAWTGLSDSSPSSQSTTTAEDDPTVSTSRWAGDPVTRNVQSSEWGNYAP